MVCLFESKWLQRALLGRTTVTGIGQTDHVVSVLAVIDINEYTIVSNLILRARTLEPQWVNLLVDSTVCAVNEALGISTNSQNAILCS